MAFIYIIHPLILQIIGKVVERFGSETVTGVYMMIRPVVIYAVSIMFAAIYYKLKEKFAVHKADK